MAAFPPEEVYVLIKNKHILATYNNRNAAQAAAYRQIRKIPNGRGVLVEGIEVRKLPLKSY